MKVLICGECFSPNLGDGIIAFSLERMVQDVLPDSHIELFDISGRSGYCVQQSPQSTRKSIKILRSMHRKIYTSCHSYTLIANVLRSRFLRQYDKQCALLRATLANMDYVLIGGGQLLQDNRLAFPLAISTIVSEARKLGLPVSFFSVGVGKKWSIIGKGLIANALKAENVESIVCRDELSAFRLRKLFPENSKRIGNTYDAALAAKVDQSMKRGSSRTIGLCVMHPEKIRSIDNNYPLNDMASAIRFWMEIYRGLSARGLRVKIFSNGADEDDALARMIDKNIRNHLSVRNHIYVGYRPRTPNELVCIISNFRVVVANRLHANIVATILGIPCIALGWDEKVEEFMKYSGQSDRFVNTDGKVSEIVDKVVQAMNITQPKISIVDMVDRMMMDLRNVLVRV